MSCLRNIHTTQERRANQGGQWIEDQGDYRIKIRGRRTKLPNAWDDIPRGDYSRHTSWKRSRQNQYHVIDVA